MSRCAGQQTRQGAYLRHPPGTRRGRRRRWRRGAARPRPTFTTATDIGWRTPRRSGGTGMERELKIYEIPEAGRAAKGRSLANLLPKEKDENINAFLAVKSFDTDESII